MSDKPEQKKTDRELFIDERFNHYRATTGLHKEAAMNKAKLDAIEQFGPEEKKTSKDK